MRVEFYAESLAVPAGGTAALALVGTWQDPDARSALDAAERAWHHTSVPPHKMDEAGLALRQQILSATGGVRVGVGDVIVAGGVPLRCVSSGWEETSLPTV